MMQYYFMTLACDEGALFKKRLGVGNSKTRVTKYTETLKHSCNHGNHA